MAAILTISEAQLIEGCRKGDIKSYELLYNRYCHAMYHTCLRIVVNTGDAEDILQDAFAEAFTTLDALKNTNAFAGWLKKIVINKSLNFITRKKASRLVIDAVDTDIADGNGAIDERAFEQQVEAIAEAINNLPEKQRVVVNLHIFEAMGFEEIAALLAMPSATVRSHYLRAKQKIIKEIGLYGR